MAESTQEPQHDWKWYGDHAWGCVGITRNAFAQMIGRANDPTFTLQDAVTLAGKADSELVAEAESVKDYRRPVPHSGPNAEFLPAESIAFTLAKAQVERGDQVSPNIATVLVLALDRLVNGVDWRDEGGE